MLHSRVALRASCVKIMNMFAWAAALPRGDSVMLPPASRVAVSISAFSVITAVFERTAVSVPAGLGRRRGTMTPQGRYVALMLVGGYGGAVCKRILGLVNLPEQTEIWIIKVAAHTEAKLPFIVAWAKFIFFVILNQNRPPGGTLRLKCYDSCLLSIHF